MRDPARIDRIAALLARGWKKMPDQRFGQFLDNLRAFYGIPLDWNTEDHHLERELRRLLGEETPVKPCPRCGGEMLLFAGEREQCDACERDACLRRYFAGIDTDT